jgi:hypothetical protein
VAAGTPDQVHPRELLVVADREFGSTGQRLLRPLVVRTQELDPTDLAPSDRGYVVPSSPLSERRSLVQRSRTFLVRTARRVNECTAQRHKRLGEERDIVDVSSGRNCTPHAMETGLDRTGGKRRLAGLQLRQHCGTP